MKRIISLATILILAAVFTACNNNRGQTEYSPFIPFTENLVLVYEVERVQGAEGRPALNDVYLVFNSHVRDNRLQRFIQMGNGSTITEVVEMVDGRPVNIIGGGNTFAHHADILDDSRQMFYVILPETIEVGARWRAHPMIDSDEMMKEITGIDVRITTPYGTFDTIEVRVTGQSDREYHLPPVRYIYYAQGIGMVMQRDYAGILASLEWWELEDYAQSIHVTTLMDVKSDGLAGNTFTFHANAEGYVPSVPVHLRTNNDLLDVMNVMLRDAAYATLGVELAADVSILSYFANRNTENLHLDFSAGFLREMRTISDPHAEELILLAIVDIFAFFFNAEGVTITVDGQPYSGPFISFRSMEFWPREGSLIHLPEPPPYTPEEAEFAMAIIDSLRQPLADAIEYVTSQPWESVMEIWPVLEPVFSLSFVEFFFAMEEIPHGIERWLWSDADPLVPIQVDEGIFQAGSDDKVVLFRLEENGWRIDFILLHE